MCFLGECLVYFRNTCMGFLKMILERNCAGIAKMHAELSYG